jgi:hypothetical protein
MLVETLGEAYSLSWRVHMRCALPGRDGLKSVRDCLFRCELDMETLVATRGRAFPLARLAERLRCPRCGSRQVVVVFDPPSGRAVAG